MSNWGVSSDSDIEQGIDKALTKEIVTDWRKAKSISDSKNQIYKDTNNIVNFVKAISDYESVDDME